MHNWKRFVSTEPDRHTRDRLGLSGKWVARIYNGERRLLRRENQEIDRTTHQPTTEDQSKCLTFRGSKLLMKLSIVYLSKSEVFIVLPLLIKDCVILKCTHV